jgi:hypothetical protein
MLLIQKKQLRFVPYLLGAFVKLRKGAIGFVMSVSPFT